MNADNFEIKHIIINNELIVDIICSDENYMYAFYLYKDGVRIGIQWYSNAKTAKFILSSSGVYKVICFLKCGEEKVIKETNSFKYWSCIWMRAPRPSSTVCPPRRRTLTPSIWIIS